MKVADRKGITPDIGKIALDRVIRYSEASSMFAAFAQRRRLVTIGSWLSEDVRVAVEYNNEADYGKGSSGTGRESDAWIMRLTYEW